jgi:type IV secretion system protein TrbL
MRHDLRRLAALIPLVVLVMVAGSGLVAPASAQAASCDDIPSVPLVPNPVKTGCKVITKAPGAIKNPKKAVVDIATAPLQAAGDQVMQGVTKWVADGASWLVGQAGKLIDQTTTPRLQSAWFGGQYRSMAALAAIFALPLLLLSVLQGVLRRDSGVVVRAAFVHLPAAFILTAGAVTVVTLFLTLTDEMSAQVAGSVGSDAKDFFSDVGKTLTKLGAAGGNGAVPLFAVFLGGLIAAVGAFFVWVELLIRSAAIYVTVLFLPFTFVAMIWPHTAKWCRRLVEVLFSIIFAKFVIVAIMALAAAGLGQSRSQDAFQGVLAGTALMLLAALSPFALLRLIPMAEAAAHTSWRSGTGSQALGPIAGPAATMRRVVDANWGGSSGSGGGLRAAPAGGGAGLAAAGVAGGAGTAAVGGLRSQPPAGNGGGGGGGGRSSGGGGGSRSGDGGPSSRDQARYAASGGGGQAARPTSSPQASGWSTSASPSASGSPATPSAPSTPPAASPGGPSSPAGRGAGSGSVPPPSDPARERKAGGRDGR